MKVADDDCFSRLDETDEEGECLVVGDRIGIGAYGID